MRVEVDMLGESDRLRAEGSDVRLRSLTPQEMGEFVGNILREGGSFPDDEGRMARLRPVGPTGSDGEALEEPRERLAA